MRKKIIKIAYILIVYIFIIHSPLPVLAWGDNSGLPDMRPSYTMKQIDEGILGDTITFNSISDNTSLGGNEKNFVAAREYNDTDVSHLFQADSITVQNGKEYVIRMYVHNNSPKGRNAIAKDTRVFFNVPNVSSKTVKVTGFLDSSNAYPTEYWDHVNFISDTAFHLEYICGSAILSGNDLDEKDRVTGKTKTTKLGDEIVTDINGVLIGTDTLNGQIPGCFPYSQIITIRVKVVYDQNYTVDAKVRLADSKDRTWKKEINATIGDTVELQTEYRNTGGKLQESVNVKSILPEDLEYIPGSTRLYTANHPDGIEAVNDSVIEGGINIGNYCSGANAFIRISALVKSKQYVDSYNALQGKTQVAVNNTDSCVMQDSASIIIKDAESRTDLETHFPEKTEYIPKELFILINMIIIVIYIVVIVNHFMYK